MTPVVRPLKDSDIPFVWETSLKVRKPHGTMWADHLREHGDNALALLQARISTTNVMEADGVLIGFAHRVRDIVRMVYVKRELRGFGYGLELLAPAPAERVNVWRPNPCWRRWAYARNIPWQEATHAAE